MFEKIPEIMREAGKIMLAARGVENEMRAKGEANFVTSYDVEVEKYLFQELGELLPSAVLLGDEEEENHTELIRTRRCLIVDPIDGTTNFIHGFGMSAVSVGVSDCGVMTYGAVYDPYTGVLCHAERGHGTFLQDADGGETPVHVSDRGLADALAGFGTCPYYKDELGEKSFRAVYRLYRRARDVRRGGSAALDLLMTARGILDVFFEYRLSPWDYAAGSLLVTEAGGVITQTDGSPITLDKPCSIFAGNPRAYRELFEAGIL